jgi:hypothetical protein
VVVSTENDEQHRLLEAFCRLMNDVDAAAHMLSYMTTNEALTGLGALSRGFKAQIDAALPIVRLHYIHRSRISPLSRFTSLRHLMIGDTGGAHCLEGLATISASLESLALEVRSPAIAKALNTLSLSSLKHLHVGHASDSLYETKFMLNPESCPLLETFAMKTLDPHLHDFLVQETYPQLKRLAFEVTHPLCGGEPWYLKIPHWGYRDFAQRDMAIDILCGFPQTPALRFACLSDFEELIRQNGGGLPHLT